jgi:uncharacterized SAM-binding protein YcdF (DUF218 family)
MKPMFFIVRTLESLIYPIGLIWVFLTVAAIVFYRRKHRRAAIGCAILSAFLFVGGATPAPEWLMARLERPYANATVGNAAPADVAIVLGGNLIPSAHDTFEISLTSSADRIVAGVELLRQKKVGALIIGGGGARLRSHDVSEGKRVENFLKTWNVAPGAVIGLEQCENTREEALRARTVMAEHKWTNAIVVTSAFHMPRALATLRKQGIDARPVACDFEALPVMEREVTSFRLVPVLDHLRNLTLYIHEMLGWYYYAARGWI